MSGPHPKWSRYDAAHGSRIRMILDGPDKGSWVAYCLDCDWTMNDPVPPFVAGEAAREHEEEARHAYE